MGYNFEACKHVGCRITQHTIDVQSSRFAHSKHEIKSGQYILPHAHDKRQCGLCEDLTQTTPHCSERVKAT